MIKIENTEVVGWEHAIRGMRNPLNSWDKSDSGYRNNPIKKYVFDGEVVVGERYVENYGFEVGDNDLDLMKRLVNAGTDHRKFMRMIVVYTDIVAPLYWWKEFDTYKVGTVRNSCSTMHKIQAKEFTIEDFSHENMSDELIDLLNEIIESLNRSRKLYVEGYVHRYYTIKPNDKLFWWDMIQLLPSSYNQRSTVMLNYEVLANMYHSRKNHKLDEWKEFCRWIETLPYAELITGGKE